MEPCELWIIEDDVPTADLYRLTFADAPDRFNITLFPDLASFRAAAQRPKRRLPHLLIADVCLPDGKFCDLFLSASEFSALTGLKCPVIVASAWCDLNLIRGMLRGGAVDFITKPFPPEEMLAKVERHLGQLAAVVKPSISIDALTLKVSSPGGPAATLTSKQFQIMVLLRSRLGQSIGRDEIVSTIWGTTRISPKNVSVHLSILRQKIKPLGLAIEFIPPQSYVLRGPLTIAGASDP